jgi:hypothetical protein
MPGNNKAIVARERRQEKKARSVRIKDTGSNNKKRMTDRIGSSKPQDVMSLSPVTNARIAQGQCRESGRRWWCGGSGGRVEGF